MLCVNGMSENNYKKYYSICKKYENKVWKRLNGKGKKITDVKN